MRFSTQRRKLRISNEMFSLKSDFFADLEEEPHWSTYNDSLKHKSDCLTLFDALQLLLKKNKNLK